MFFRGLDLLSPRSAREYSRDRKSRTKVAHPPQRLFSCSSDVDHQSTVDISHQQYQAHCAWFPMDSWIMCELLRAPGASPCSTSPPQRCPFSFPLCPHLLPCFPWFPTPYGHCLWSQPKAFALPWGISCSGHPSDTVLCPSHRRLCHTHHRTLSPWTLVIQSHTATQGSSSHVFPGGPSYIQGPWVSGTLESPIHH